MSNGKIQEWATNMVNGDNNAKKNLIDYYTKYINNLVKTKYKNSNYDKDSLIEAGFNGLIKSITDYYVNNDQYFATNTRNNIHNYIYREISIQNDNAKIIQKLATEMINGDDDARKKLINHYINYIVYFVKKNFNKNKYNQEDLIQTGVVFVLDAVNNYYENNRLYFSTYICNYIKKKFILELKEQDKNLNIQYIGLNNNYLGKSLTIDTFENIENKVLVEKGAKNLSQRNAEIMYLHIWQDYTLDELSKIYKISKARIQQIMEENKEKIKNEILNIKKKRKPYTKRIIKKV